MLGKTHVLVAAIIAVLVLQVTEVSHPYLFFLLFVIASLLPDIDHPGSTLGRKLWPFSWGIRLVFGHRGLIHSIFIPIVLVVLGWYTGYLWLGAAVAGGYFIHLVTDALTPSGVKPFGIGPTFRGMIRTGGFLETIFYGLLLLLLAWMIVSNL